MHLLNSSQRQFCRRLQATTMSSTSYKVPHANKIRSTLRSICIPYFRKSRNKQSEINLRKMPVKIFLVFIKSINLCCKLADPICKHSFCTIAIFQTYRCILYMCTSYNEGLLGLTLAFFNHYWVMIRELITFYNNLFKIISLNWR